jgi:hypothetical protein
MRPTPRKLALLMSIAGLGASLGEAVQARSDVVAHARQVATLGLADPAGPKDFETAVVPERNFPFALAASPDGAVDAEAEAPLAAARRAFRRDAEEPPMGASFAAALPSEDERDAAAPAIGPRSDAVAQATVAPPARAPLGTPPTPKEPTGRWAVNGIRVRQPKGPPVSAKPWESISASGDGPKNLSAAGRDAETATESGASVSQAGEQAGLAASAADTSFTTPTEELRAYFALHYQSLATPADAALEGRLPAIDIDLDMAGKVDPNLEPAPEVDLDVDTAQSVDLNLDMPELAAPSFEAPRGSAPSLDPEPGPAAKLDLDLDLDLDLGSIAAPEPSSNVTTNGALDLNLDLGPELDVNLDTLAESYARFGIEPPVALTPVPVLEPSRAPATVTNARAEKQSIAPCFGMSCADVCSPGTADRMSEAGAGLHDDDRIMRSLEALLSEGSSAPGRFGGKINDIFVAGYAEKALLNMASVLRPPGPARRPAARTQIEVPSVVAASAQGAGQSRATAGVPLIELPAAAGESTSVQEPSGQLQRTEQPSAMGEALALNESTLDRHRARRLHQRQPRHDDEHQHRLDRQHRRRSTGCGRGGRRFGQPDADSERRRKYVHDGPDFSGYPRYGGSEHSQ